MISLAMTSIAVPLSGETVMWFLIENNTMEVYKFRSKRELFRFARKYGLKIKKSPTCNHTYYTDSYVVLPTE